MSRLKPATKALGGNLRKGRTAPSLTERARVEDPPWMVDWRSTVEDLSQRRFTNLDQALDALIETVLLEMRVVEEDSCDIRDFLRTVLGADPDVVSTLRRALVSSNRSRG